jgi:hypothetical protein
VFLLSKPDGWSINLKFIAKERADGVASISTAMSELLALGYAKRQLVRDSKGVLCGTETTIFENPEDIDTVKHTEGMGEPNSENPISVNSVTDKGTDSLKTEVVKDTDKEKIEIPEKLLNIKGFSEKWNEWVEFRRVELKKPLKPTSIKKQFKVLLEDIDPIACLEKSMNAGYTGIFPSRMKFNIPSAAPVRKILTPLEDDQQ